MKGSSWPCFIMFQTLERDQAWDTIEMVWRELVFFCVALCREDFDYQRNVKREERPHGISSQKTSAFDES